MLYLIQTPNYGRGVLYKVGFTNDIPTRFSQYQEHNPLTTLIGVRDGGEKEEKMLHLLLEGIGLKSRYLEEWFIGDPKVPEVFHWGFGKIKRRLWKMRGKLVYGGKDWKSRGTTRFHIFKDLHKNFGGTWIDEVYFGGSYRENSFPKKLVDWVVGYLRRINVDRRGDAYQKIIREAEGNPEWKEELRKRKDPILFPLRFLPT